MIPASHYREQAAKMRKFAEEAANEPTREQLLKVAAEYEKLAKRAEQREANG